MLGIASKTKIRQIPTSHGYIRKGARSRVSTKDEFEYSAHCPVCDKRVLDITEHPNIPVRVRLKCPHCRVLIRISLGRAPP